MKHTLVALVENQPGVLQRVANLFSRRGFNIESLTVGHTETDRTSRMTIVIDGKSREEIRAMLELAGITDFVEDYTMDVVDPRRTPAQNAYDSFTMGLPIDRAPPGMPLDDEFSDDLLAQAAAAGMDETPRVDEG